MNYNFIGCNQECICNEAWEQAYANTKEFLNECGLELYVLNSDHCMRGGYRVVFDVGNPSFCYRTTLWMPILPLEQLKSSAENEADTAFSEKLIINGKELPWNEALITPEMVHSYLSERIDELEDEAEASRYELEELDAVRADLEDRFSIESADTTEEEFD